MRCASFLLLFLVLFAASLLSDALDTKEIKKILPKQPKTKPTTTNPNEYDFDNAYIPYCEEDCDEVCANDPDYHNGHCHSGMCTCY